MATYQPGAKRQKVREVRDDYFQGIDKIEYNNMAGPGEVGRYRYYCGTERVLSRTMEEWLKYSVSLTQFTYNGSDLGSATLSRPWDDRSNSVENHKRCIKAFFDFCAKLGVKYWTAFDTDLVPVMDADESRTGWDEVVDYAGELSQRYHMKLLWLAPDLHSHPRYASGAFTSNDAPTFSRAAAQIKKCLDTSQRLNAENFLLWPYREGYSPLHTDVAKELKLFAKLLKMTSEYKDRLNYRCQLLIMPYYCERHTHAPASCRDTHTLGMYMWDVTSCLYFLRNFNLERWYKVCTPPGHHMVMANVYNMLGGVTITNEVDQYDTKQLTLMMKSIIDQGAAPPGGVSLRLRVRRESGAGAGGDLRELVTAHVKYMDAGARGLRRAASMHSEQILAKHIQQRYSTYSSGFGSRLVGSDVSVEECEEYYKKNLTTEPAPSKCEHMELTFQRYLETSDHI